LSRWLQGRMISCTR